MDYHHRQTVPPEGNVTVFRSLYQERNEPRSSLRSLPACPGRGYELAQYEHWSPARLQVRDSAGASATDCGQRGDGEEEGGGFRIDSV
jgi:hypothetical protein